MRQCDQFFDYAGFQNSLRKVPVSATQNTRKSHPKRTFFIGLKSKTILQSVALAIILTLNSRSSSNLNNGSATPASTRWVLRFLTLRLKDRVRRHAAARMPLLRDERHDTITVSREESMMALRVGSRREETAARAKRALCRV